MPALVCATMMLGGCNGGTVDRHALTKDSAIIDSMACEGVLLAREIATGKTTVFFAREQANVLRIQSSNLADALATRKTLPSIEHEVRAKSREAASLSATLRRLHDRPSDRSTATSVEQRLRTLGHCK